MKQPDFTYNAFKNHCTVSYFLSLINTMSRDLDLDVPCKSLLCQSVKLYILTSAALYISLQLLMRM